MYTPGEDWDLEAALEYNPQAFSIEDVEEAICTQVGEPDEGSWKWAIRLKDGTRGLLEGWCDYTGWDCQSGAQWAPTPKVGAE